MTNSIEELVNYLHKQQITKAEKWGLLYPIINILEHCSYHIRKTINQIVWSYQRIVRKHHASDNDLHCLDLHISKIVLPKLETFKIKVINDSSHNKKEAWLNILDEIIYAFRWNIYANWQRNSKKERIFYLNHFHEDDSNLDYFHYYDSVLVKKAAERAQNGFELFGKYFTSLWNY